MQQVISAHDRSFRDYGWLKTYWLFSFADYYDAKNIQHGGLRVFNDDIVQGGTGFSTHPHEEMEIVSVVLSGEMTHRDSMGNVHFIGENEVQVMSAGTGITHSEMNESDKPVHFFQIWFPPSVRGLTPSYDQVKLDPAQWTGRLLPLASGHGEPGALRIHADAVVSRAALSAGEALVVPIGPGRHSFLYPFKGSLTVNGTALETCDQLRLTDVETLNIHAPESAEFILIHTQ